jgi:hypothetical protein
LPEGMLSSPGMTAEVVVGILKCLPRGLSGLPPRRRCGTGVYLVDRRPYKFDPGTKKLEL